MLRKRQNRQTALYTIDNITYSSKTLYDFHVLCKEALDKKLIESFKVPLSMGKKSRYTTYKPIINGIEYDSLMEGRYYLYLLRLKSEGVVKKIERQIAFELQPKFKKAGKIFRPITYISDFVVHYAEGNVDVIDVKGKETPEFKLKRKLFEFQYSDYTLKTIQYYPDTDEWVDTAIIKRLQKEKKNSKCRKQKK